MSSTVRAPFGARLARRAARAPPSAPLSTRSRLDRSLASVQTARARRARDTRARDGRATHGARVGRAAAGALFADGQPLDDDDHRAVTAVHEFLQNIYSYSRLHPEAYKSHLLCDTTLVPHLVLPYLQC